MIKKFKTKKSLCQVKDNIWDTNLAEMESLSSCIPGVKYLLCVTDVFTKYAWVKSLKDKKAKTVFQGFIEIVNKFKPKLLLVDQGIKFNKNIMQNLLDDNDILIYWTHNEGESVIAERSMRLLKGKIF